MQPPVKVQFAFRFYQNFQRIILRAEIQICVAMFAVILATSDTVLPGHTMIAVKFRNICRF